MAFEFWATTAQSRVLRAQWAVYSMRDWKRMLRAVQTMEVWFTKFQKEAKALQGPFM